MGKMCEIYIFTFACIFKYFQFSELSEKLLFYIQTFMSDW